ncbi:MAG: TIGR04283 family arsenosugar biosynthesis glycosyltransferase [Pseudomonadota bacterium]
MRAVTIIVPVHNDNSALRALLSHLPTLDGYQDRVEVLIAASPVDADLQALADEHNATLIECDRGRGRQMNQAAEAADGSILWFLHADAIPNRSALIAIRQACEDGADGGFFRFVFSGPQTKARHRLARLINWRAERGVAYGDQGLFFKKPVFDQLGGFAPEPLFEEVPLVKAVKSNGTFVSLKEEIIVDARRWESDGWVKRTVANRLLAWAYALGVSPKTLAHWYGLAKRNT